MNNERWQPGLRDELLTNAHIEHVDDERWRIEAVSPADAIERLSRHLRGVARRLRRADSVDTVAEAAAAINAAVDALAASDPSLLADSLQLPPQLLTGVLPARSGAETPVLPAPPSIPLATTELLVNGEGQPTLGQLLTEEIACAHHVDVICAFVGWTGVRNLIDHLDALVQRGGRIRLVTSTYLGATSKQALDRLAAIGADVRVRYDGQATKLHAKAWLFHRPGGLDTSYIGSSNLSQAALHDGLEWNVRLARADAPGVFDRMQATFDSYWNDAAYEPYDPAQDGERLEAELARARGADRHRHTARDGVELERLKRELDEAYSRLEWRARPHQQRILDSLELRRIRHNEHRNLIVSATGTGKTVIAALDFKALCERLAPGAPRPSLLFVAHRERILEQARATFRHVLKDGRFGEIMGGSRGSRVAGRHVFAMVQTLGSEGRLADLPRDGYDVVYVDEVHHAAAPTWRRLVEHLAPKELVGLTATPERADGAEILDLFGYRPAAELRLWDAIDDQLLVPFQYFGVDDGTDLTALEWHGGEYAVGALSDLYTGDHERVRRTLQAIRMWVEHPERMRALGFCVTKAHAEFMAEQFTRFGFKSAFLVGDHDQDTRNRVLGQLERGDLNCVFNVDVLGEGVDVPAVDTLLLLRPTQSPVVFAQQIGRGLRHHGDKGCCTVIDLIGQHRREFRFDRRMQSLINAEHGTVREQAERGFPFLPAGCEITLDEVSTERVLGALRQAASDRGLRALREDVRRLRPGTLREFLEMTGRDLESLYGGTLRAESTWTALRRAAGLVVDESPDPAEEKRILKRIGGLLHVTDPLRCGKWSRWLEGSSPPAVDSLSQADERLLAQLLVQLGGPWESLAEAVTWLWQFEAVRRELVELLDLLDERADVVTRPVLGHPSVPLQVHARYTRQEVLVALGLSSAQHLRTHREGVLADRTNDVQLMFVTLNKDERFYAPSVQYHDYAISSELFHWESPNNWRQDGKATEWCIRGARERFLFVREQGRGSHPRTRFRFLGPAEFVSMERERPVAITWHLQHPLPEVAFEAARVVAAG